MCVCVQGVCVLGSECMGTLSWVWVRVRVLERMSVGECKNENEGLVDGEG